MGVQIAVWGQEPLKPGDLYGTGTHTMSVEEKRAALRAKAESLWPKAQP